METDENKIQKNDDVIPVVVSKRKIKHLTDKMVWCFFGAITKQNQGADLTMSEMARKLTNFTFTYFKKSLCSERSCDITFKRHR